MARVDLKSDRQASRLLVRQLGLEPAAPPETQCLLAEELRRMARWLNLEDVHWE